MSTFGLPYSVNADPKFTMDEMAELFQMAAQIQAEVSVLTGASLATLLGADLLKEIKSKLDTLTQAANEVKTAINSSLSIADLKRLGLEKLRELGASSQPADDPYAGYSINEIANSVSGKR